MRPVDPASSWSSDLGDGIAIAAGPSLVASLTQDPSWAPRQRSCSAVFVVLIWRQLAHIPHTDDSDAPVPA